MHKDGDLGVMSESILYDVRTQLLLSISELRHCGPHGDTYYLLHHNTETCPLKMPLINGT
jgi:hypothetical protein